MATVTSSKRHLDITSTSLSTSSNVDVGAKLTIGTTDANTTSTTALVLNSTEVEKRTLGSAAFSTSTDFVAVTGDTVTGNIIFNDSVELRLGTSSDFKAFHNGSNTYLKNYTGTFYIDNEANDNDIVFRSDDGAGSLTNYIQIDGSEERTLFNKDIRVNDNVQVQVGSSADLQFYHNGTDSVINNLVGQLYIQNGSDDKDIIFRTDNGSGGLDEYIRLDGSDEVVRIYKDTKLHDNDVLQIGSAADLRIYHDATNSYVDNITGHLTFTNYADDSHITFKSDDGNGATETYFYLNGVTGFTEFTNNAQFVDNAQARFGSGSDLRIYHDGSNSYINDSGTGELKIASNTLRITNAAGTETSAKFVQDSFVELFHNNSSKFKTTTYGVEVTGGISSDGNAKSYTWRALNNSSNSGNSYWKIADISGADQSSRFIVTIAGRSTSYSDGTLPAMGHIVGQLNNDNNWDLVFYNHSTASSEVVTEVAIVDDGTLGVELWIKTGNYAEITASGHISDGTFTVYSNASSDGFTSAPDGYTTVTEYTSYNSGNLTAGQNVSISSGVIASSHPAIGQTAGTYGDTANGQKIDTITIDENGHVTNIATGATGNMTGFFVEDGDGTEVQINNANEWKFVEGTGIDINWTDTDTGNDSDPYDLTFAIKDNSIGITQLNVTDGTNGQVLTTNGSGTLSFTTVTSGTSYGWNLGGTDIESGDEVALGGGLSLSGTGGSYTLTSAHTFDSLTSKTSGTGDYSTTGDLQSGRNSGGVALTINDGYGNANITWNHRNGTPEQNGNAARIEVNTDSTTGATMWFEIKSGMTSGTAASLTNVMQMTESGLSMESGKTISAGGKDSDDWNTAHGWGNHASAGYITGVGWTDIQGDQSEIPVSGFNNDAGYLTAHPNITAASSSDNSGRTYIQDITLDSNGHVTGIATATETVTNTDTNYYVDGLSFNTGTGVLTASVNGATNQTVDLDGRYLEKTYRNNFTRVGYGNSGAVRYHKLATIQVNGTYDDYNATFEWTTRYASGLAGIHVHSDNDTTADVMGAWFVDWNPNTQSKLTYYGNWIKYTQSGDTVEIWVKTVAWQEFDYLLRDSVTEGTPAITWYDESTTTDTGTEPSNLNSFTNDTHSAQGYLTAHPNITAASSSDNSGRTYIQDITLDSNGHVTGITTATETVTNTNTTYSAGSGLDLTSTTFSVEADLRDGITHVGKDSNNYIQFDSTNGRIDFYAGGVFVARMESDGDLHIKGDVIAFSSIFA